MKGTYYIVGLVVVLCVLVSPRVYAALPCGNIVTPANYYGIGDATSTIPINDCNNPFLSIGPLSGVFMNDQLVAEGDTFSIPNTGIQQYGFAGESYFSSGASASYYLHDGNDYIPSLPRMLASGKMLLY